MIKLLKLIDKNFTKLSKRERPAIPLCVKTKENLLFRLLFVTNTFTWRLIKNVIEKKPTV